MKSKIRDKVGEQIWHRVYVLYLVRVQVLNKVWNQVSGQDGGISDHVALCLNVMFR